MTDREKLIELVNGVLRCLPWGEISSHTAEDVADHIIANGVTIPVRCEDCKHLGFKGLCDGVCNKKMIGIVKPDDFCSYGERMVENA